MISASQRTDKHTGLHTPLTPRVECLYLDVNRDPTLHLPPDPTQRALLTDEKDTNIQYITNMKPLKTTMDQHGNKPSHVCVSCSTSSLPFFYAAWVDGGHSGGVWVFMPADICFLCFHSTRRAHLDPTQAHTFISHNTPALCGCGCPELSRSGALL